MRCAIYTRKSSEEGLDQEFNSLHAQREACEAFIKSQRHEGWVALKQAYDDGGYSGGTMERPGLQALLTEIKAGMVDTVVVYKVDRLTRALSDFAKMVDLFDTHSVSFVSVTQQFNTTTSMGRLTLNVLLSFAQFEREVTGERIRDKVAASKKKGLWMGGTIPMGYDIKDRKLVINEDHASIVQELFKLYIAKSSTRAVADEATKRGYLTQKRITQAGKERGGHPLSKGHIDQILTNRIYIGEITHKDQSYPGEHAAIIDQKTWDQAQAIRKRNGTAHRRKTNIKHPSLLSGLLFDTDGMAMTATHAVKNGKRYRHYVSRALVTGEVCNSEARPVRVPAHELERFVIDALLAWLQNDNAIIEALCFGNTNTDAIDKLKRAKAYAASLRSMIDSEQEAVLRELLHRVDILATQIVLHVSASHLMWLLKINSQPKVGSVIQIRRNAQFTRVGGETRLLTPEDAIQPRGEPDAAIVRMLVRAYDWAERLIEEPEASIDAIAKADGVSPRYVARLLPFAFLAPELTDRLLRGEHSKSLSATQLAKLWDIPVCWKNQKELIERF